MLKSRGGGMHHSLLSPATRDFTHFHLHKKWMSRSSPNGGFKWLVHNAEMWFFNNHCLEELQCSDYNIPINMSSSSVDAEQSWHDHHAATTKTISFVNLSTVFIMKQKKNCTNWPLPTGAFQGQWNNWNELSRLRIPTGRRQTSWLWKHSQGVEPGTTSNKSS